ncbi:hypothetical protein PIB30_067290, partial [Stylosanthes scabra]|nr:hypothetical protein [Stylosanthes scabra]
MRENWARVGWRIGSNQFSRRSHQLPIVITFDPELRLTHGLRLREALVALFPSTTHANHGKCGELEDGSERLNMRTAMDCAWMLDGTTKDRVYALSLASRPILFQELRVYMRWEPYGWIGPEGRYDERNDVEMIEASSRLHIQNFMNRLRSSRFDGSPNRFVFTLFSKFNVQNALRIDSSSSESILKRRNMVSK